MKMTPENVRESSFFAFLIWHPNRGKKYEVHKLDEKAIQLGSFKCYGGQLQQIFESPPRSCDHQRDYK